MKVFRRIQLIASALILAAALIFPSPAFAGERLTRYTTIRYRNESDLMEFGRKVGGSRLSLVRDGQRSGELIAETVDRIVFRVRTLLDMHPPGFHAVIVIHGSYAELKEVYRSLGLAGEVPVAFYTSRGESVHLSLDELTDGILAHELAHAIINAHYNPPLPAKMQEILAQYVDRHLWDE